MSDTQFLLGKLVQGNAERDAVHIAVVPVIAAHDLSPSAAIGLLPDGRAATKTDKILGIVDPFLREVVRTDQKFWMFLLPNTITSLRHVWTHPDFVDEPSPKVALKSTSEEWMRAWAMEHMGYDYYGDEEKLSPERAYANAIEAGRTHSVGPYESARDYIDSEWWSHWEAITGQSGDREEYFRCAC